MRRIFGAASLMVVIGLPSALAETIAERPIRAEEREHWAYQPLSDPSVPVILDSRWKNHPIDAFVKAKLDAENVEPLPAAGRLTLLRRLSFDLTGLPPSTHEVEEYLADKRPNAYERLVDRLLALPAYGERWGQHWLDLARFAETDGFEHDLVRPNAWRYRDWVIDALNADMPFDEFVRLQLAGDLVRPGDRDAAIATGFLLCGPDMPDINLQEERRHLVLNEIASTVGSVFLGLQVGCAQCHDHKYDAVTQYDFYRLRAFFESAEIFQDHPVPTVMELAARQAVEAAIPPAIHEKRQRQKELEDLSLARFREKNPDVIPTLAQQIAELSEADRREHSTLKKELAKAAKLPPLSLGRVLREGPQRSSHLYLRGDFRQKGPIVECKFPAVVNEDPTTVANGSAPRRAQLAHWLTRPDHPLVTRVIVNRLWQWHFGQGIAAAPSDFGVMGYEPTHPELLDWLARRFVSDGWSLKQFHRLVVSSETYKLASGPYDPEWSTATSATAKIAWEASRVKDAENNTLWHRQRTRLDGEAIRDAMLFASGRLSSGMGGPGVRPPLSPEVTITLLKGQWPITANEEEHRRRSIYLFVRRNLRYPMFDVFDRPDTNASCPQRHESTTAPQALILFNSDFSLDCARRLADLLRKAEPNEVSKQIGGAYLRILSRFPSVLEIGDAKRFWAQQDEIARSQQTVDDSRVRAESRALADLCLALFNANEFVFLE